MPYYKRNLIVLSLTIFLASVSWNQVVPFLSLFMKEMGIVDDKKLLTWVGIVFALQSSASIISMPFWGKLGDKYGRKPMTIRAGVCLTGIYFAMSLCQTPLQLAVLRFLNGALTGFIPSSMALIATNTPEDRVSKSLAFTQTVSSIGLIVGPAVGGFLAEKFGYRCSMQVSGASVLISTVLVWLLVREVNKVELANQTTLLQDLFLSLRSKALSSVMLTVMVAGIYSQAIYPMLALHLGNLNGGASVELTGKIMALPPLALAITAMAWTSLGGKRGHHNTIKLGLIGAALSGFMLFFIHDISSFAAIFFISGIFLAAIGPCTAAIICERVPESFRGRAYGMVQSSTTVGALIAPLAATRIAAEYGIPSIFLFVGLIALIGVIVFSSLASGWGTKAEDRQGLESSIFDA